MLHMILSAVASGALSLSSCNSLCATYLIYMTQKPLYTTTIQHNLKS